MTARKPLHARSAPAMPWYRQPWPWLLMAPPLVAVVAGFVTLWIAVSSDDGLVADDYYKRGLAINRTLERAEFARALELQAEVAVEGGYVAVAMSAREGVSLPQRLHLTLVHPTRAGLDQVVELGREGEGRYRGTVGEVSAGRWNVLLEDEERLWRMTAQARLPDNKRIVLGAVDR